MTERNSSTPVVVVLGASTNPERYAYKAQQRLMAAGYQVIPINPAYATVLGLPCLPDLSTLIAQSQSVAAVTLYLGPQRLVPVLNDLIALAPKVVIANPGTEDVEQARLLESVGIRVVPACTLVLLASGAFTQVIA